MHAANSPLLDVVSNELIILIPAKNEEATVGKIIREIRLRHDSAILVIDDASTDSTAKEAQTAGAKVVSLPVSLGAWGAIQTGLRYALKYDYQTAITMDADGQHEAESLVILWRTIQVEKADVVIGSFPERGSSSRRLAWSLFRNLSGLGLEDLTSGLRAYNRKAIRLLASQKAALLDYQDMGVLLLLHHEGLHILETPITMNPRPCGRSKIFNSWWSVGRYMMYTIMLCTAKAVRIPFSTCFRKRSKKL